MPVIVVRTSNVLKSEAQVQADLDFLRKTAQEAQVSQQIAALELAQKTIDGMPGDHIAQTLEDIGANIAALRVSESTAE